MDIQRYIRPPKASNGTDEISIEEWRRRSEIEDAKDAILTLNEVADFIIEASGTLEIAFEIMRKMDIDHTLNIDLTSETPWALYKLNELKVMVTNDLESLERKS